MRIDYIYEKVTTFGTDHEKIWIHRPVLSVHLRGYTAPKIYGRDRNQPMTLLEANSCSRISVSALLKSARSLPSPVINQSTSPLDQIVIAAQLLGAHNAAMECYRRAMIKDQTFDGYRENLNQANKLSRTYAVLLDALNRHRGKGQQKVTSAPSPCQNPHTVVGTPPAAPPRPLSPDAISCLGAFRTPAARACG